MTDEFAPAAEFDGIARLAAGLLDAPVATVTRLAERALRLGGSGMSWPAGDEEQFLRSISRTEPAAYELSRVPGAELLVSDGMSSAFVVPLRIPGVFLAIYAPVPLVASLPLRRRLGDLGELASQFLHRLPAEPSPSGLAERRVLEFVRGAVDRMAISDDDGRLLYVNEAFARSYSTTVHDLTGRSLSELVAPAWKHLPGLARVRNNVAMGLTQPFVRELELPNGRVQSWEVAASTFVLDGETHIGLIGRDLSAATQRLEVTMESAAIGIAHVALDGQFLRFNAQLQKLTGREPRELRVFRDSLDVAPPADQRGMSWIDALGLVGRLDLATVRAQFVATKVPYRFEYELVRPDKTTAWIDLSIAPVIDTMGRPDYFVLVAREITAERRADIALRGLAAALAETGPALFGRVADFLGTTLGARCVLIGRLEGASVVPTAAWLNGAPFDAPRYPLVGTPGETVQHSDLCYYPERLQDMFPADPMLGELGVNSYLGAPLRASDGRVIGLIAVLGEHAFDPALAAEDVMRLCATRVATELERFDVLGELETREEQLRQITESAQEVFWLSEWPSRHLIYVSRAFEALTGRTIASVYANRETWGAGLHPDDRARVNTAMTNIMQAPVDLLARVIRADGQLRWIHIRAAIVLDAAGRPYRVAGSFEDITQFKETQQALEERERQLTQALTSSEREVEQLQSRLGEQVELHGMVGNSQLMRTMYRRLRQAGQTDVTVLIGGESGTGKELAANALHALSARRAKPFVAINCAAIPEPLLESELFGHIKGAFTGAARDKVGLMQAAEGGTLFLDEIGDISPVLQVKLLRALQERQIRRVGDESSIPIDFRLISASHRDLRALVASGRMREDFYYRIKVFEIAMPALRDRREDIPELANHFATELGRAAGKSRLSISAEALRALLAHRWPGNVRELRNAIEHALVTITSSTIQVQDLPSEVRGTPEPRTPMPEAAAPAVASSAQNVPPAAMRERIEDALRRSGGNRAEAARLLGIGRVTLWKRMRRLGMTTDDNDQTTPED